MQRDEADRPPEERPVPCARCGELSRHGDCWGHALCGPCAGDWYRQAPTYGDMKRKYGGDEDSVRIYTEWTAKWVRARKAAA